VVESQGQWTAIDAGYGDLAAVRNVPGGEYAGRFAALGLKADAVGTVIVTHSHPDHIGGLPMFPNARVVISANEAKALEGSSAASRATFVDGETEVAPGVTVVPAYGHTPGHLLVRIGGALLHTADLFLHPIHVERPEWSVSYEADRSRAGSTRRRIIEEAGATGELLFSTHMPFPGLGRIERVDGEFRWAAA
jgi:glyoxylase-like metal-dependent hydrolase (beta-lactamase superfamily II)